MKASRISQTGAGTTAWVPTDTWKTPFSLSVACVVTGTVDYDVEHTFDNVQDTSLTITSWTNADLDGDTANASTVYTYPVKAVRLKVNSGSGTVVMTTLQAG